MSTTMLTTMSIPTIIAKHKKSIFMKISLGILLTFSAMSSPAILAADELFFTITDGALVRPTGYREWVYVGTPVTPNDMNNGKASFPEHHNVYIDPVSWNIWKETGEFRDGTIIMKELVDVGTKAAVSGSGYFQGKYLGLEATIKSKAHFPDEPGNWAYYSFSSEDYTTLTETAKAFPAAACNACHAAAAADDFVFTQYYPVLRLGKGTGKVATGGYLNDLSEN